MNDHEEAEARRAAHLRKLADIQARLPVITHNEWGKHGCLHVLAMVAAALLVAMAISWWVVYR